MAKSSPGKPFIGVMFECCNMYVRVYRKSAGTGYEGQCPRCYKTVWFMVGDGGSASRFWRVR